MAPHRGVSLTQVHPSPGADAETDIDIIAIRGLDTKSPDTWVWKSKTPGADVNWLASPHMLPERVGRARIFMCDWPADLFEQPDLIQKTAKVFARLLLAGIKRRSLPKVRHKKKKDRPIVFIASCLGGIILMNALLIADYPPSEYTAIRRSTNGIVFLATPFRGTSFQDVANWAEPGLRAWAFIRGQKVSNLLGSVKGSTFHLEDLVRRFTQLCQDKDYPCQVTTFYETGMTSLHHKFPLNWLIPSPLINLICQPKPLVDSSSATLDIVPHPLPLDRCHVMMNKFKGPEDQGYKDVAGKIEEIIQNIRTNSLLDEADTWIRDKHYTADRLKIERLSGDLLSMDQCYINLATMKQCSKNKGRKPSPFSLFNRQKVETPDETIQVELPDIFNQRKGRDSNPIRPRRILIRGRAGVGKTTLCKKIVHEFTQGTWSEWNNLFDRILWVPLRNLKLKERREIAGYNFEQLFAHEYFSLSSDKSDFARELFKAYELELETNNSKTLFLLDGLDEISQDLGEGSMSDFLNELLKQPNVIVTSRPSGKLLPDMDLELETIGFYPDQVDDYIEKVFTDQKTAEIDMESVDKVQTFVQDHWLIQGLVRIPIQLDALCYSWKDVCSDMPETMTALYQAIELSLWKKDILRQKKLHDQNPVTPYHLQGASRKRIEEFVKYEISFLESLAFTGLRDGVVEFDQKHLNYISDLIQDFLPDKTVPCLSFLRTSTTSSEVHNRSYHFIHLTFQEYFAARYFVRQWVAGKQISCAKLVGSGKIDETEPVKFFQKHKYTTRYDIMWRFVAGLLDAGKKDFSFFSQKIDEFFQKIEEEPLDLLGPTHQRLIIHCLSEVSNDLPIRTDLEQRLSKWLLFECEFLPLDTLCLASEIEFPEQALAAAFCQGSGDVKIRILRSLTKWSSMPASIVQQGASWLEGINEDDRSSAIWALEELCLPDAIVDSLAPQLKHDNEWNRRAAVDVLGNHVDLSNEILEDIVARLKDEDDWVRAAAVKALDQQTLPNEILNGIAATLEDEDGYIREAAVGVLGQQDTPNKCLKDIVARLKDTDSSVRAAAVKALGQQDDLPDEILGDIAARLKDNDKSVRKVAVKALGQQADLPNEMLKDIAATLDDKCASVRKAAVKVLGQREGLPYKVLENIAVHLKDEQYSVRKATVKSLSQRVALPDEILKAIAARLEDENSSVRQTTIESLSQRVALSDEVLKAIAARFEDENFWVRREAVVCLGQQRTVSDETLKAIAARLQDKKVLVRMAAGFALSWQPALPDEILEAMVAQLESSGGLVQRTCVLYKGYAVPWTSISLRHSGITYIKL